MKKKKSSAARPAAHTAAKPSSRPALPPHLIHLLHDGMRKQTDNDLDGAEASYRQILAECPDHYEALHLLGVVESARENYEAAEKLIGRAIELYGGGSPYFAMNYGIVLQKLGRFAEAETQFQQAISKLPDSSQAHFNLAVLLQETERMVEAKDHYRRAIALDPKDALSWTNLGKIYGQEQQLARSLECYQKAVAIKPDFVDALANLGVALHDFYRLDESYDVHARTLELDPENAIALSNIALTCRQMGRMHESIGYYSRLLMADLDNFYAHYNLSLLLLEMGDFVNGWGEFEHRWRDMRTTATIPRPFPQPRWEGSDLSNRTLLIWGEQGVGDHLRYASLFPELAARARKLIVETDPRLVPLFARSFPNVTVVAQEPTPPAWLMEPLIDLQTPLASCPRWLRNSLADFPADPVYLVADSQRRQVWRERLAALPGKLKVGVAWRSGLTGFGRQFCYAQVEQWLPILSVPDIAFVNLQYDDCRDELDSIRKLGGPELHQWPRIDLKDDFDEVAALVAELDLVIAAPISVAELSAAFGIPTWILLLNHVSVVNHGTDGFPWHPTVKLFSREWNEPWEPIVARVAEGLARLTEGVPAPMEPLSPAELLNQQGIAAYQAGAHDEAINCFRAAAEIAPTCADYPSNQGSALQAQGRLSEAETLFRQALATDPRHANSYFNLGNLLKTQGRLDEAESAYRKSLEIDPDGSGAWNNLGTMLLGRSDFDGARIALEHALQLSPDDARAHSNLALALKPLGRLADAEAHLRQAIALDPDFAEAYNNLGNQLTGLQRHQEAIDAFLQALAAKPDYPEAVFNLGCTYQDDYRLEEARQCFQALVELAPDNGRALNGLGSVVAIEGRLGDAASLFMRALTARFDDYDAHCNLGQVALQSGDLVNGWEGYAQRFRRERHPVRVRPFAMPWWDGSDLAGKSLLIWGEQGVGDEIRFASVVPDAAARSAHCLLECDARLVSLFARSFPGVQVVPRNNPPAALQADLQSPVGDLMRWLRRDFASFPGTPYLRPDPDLVARWSRRLASLPAGRRIGFGWRSRNIDRQRSECYPPIEAWMPVFELPGIVWVNLQYDSRADEVAELGKALGREIHHFDDLDLTNDFEGVAALMANLDAVVSVATAVPELSAAIGIPSFAVELAHFSPMSLGQAVSPWHASRRTFARQLGTPWQPVIAALAQALAAARATAAAPATAVEPKVLFQKGMAAHQAGDLDTADEIYAQVLTLDPLHADALHLAGVLAHQRGRQERAETLIRQAIRINPRIPWYYSNLGNIYRAQDRLDAAVMELKRAVQIDPAFADGHYNLANIEREQGLLDSAESHYRLASALAPDNATFHSNLAFILLQQGKLEEGWQMNDLWRWGDPGSEGNRHRQRFPQPLWAGEALKGRGIAIWAEQGIGDEIRFAGMFADLQAQAGRLVVECDTRLLSLFGRSWPRAHFVTRAADPDAALVDTTLDFQSPAGSLARRLRPDLKSFPRTAYLKPDENRVRFWKKRLGDLGRGLKVGICWRSHVRSAQRDRAYADIDDWRSVLAVPGVVFVNLQYGDCADERQAAADASGACIHDLADIDLMNDIDEVAALMSALDLVISAPTTVAEIAGALGLETWGMFYAHESPMELGTDLHVPWYRQLRKFVRASGQPWSDVLDAIAVCLRGRANRAFDIGTVVAEWAVAGKRHLEERELPQAIAKLRKTLLVAPANPQSQHLLGVALHQSGLYELAEKAIRAALPHEKNRAMQAVMWSNLGAAQEDMGRHEAAEASFRKAIECNARHAEAHYNLARLLGVQGHWEDAIALYHRVVELNPNLAEAYNNIGNWLMESKQDAEGALPYFEKAIALKPNDPINQYNLGKAWQDLFEIEKAAACYRRACTLKPDYAKAFNNLGACLRYMGRLDEAMATFDRVFELNPTDIDGLFNTGFIHLIHSELGRGWDMLEYRWLLPAAQRRRPFPQPLWDGSALTGKRIAVWCDQGVGDEMRALSMIPDLAKASAQVLVECDARLVALAQRSFPDVAVFPRAGQPDAALLDPAIDYQCYASGLARWLRRDLTDFPNRTSYFKAAPERVQHWQERLAALGPGLRVGISWRSRVMTRQRRASYTSLDQWGPIFSIPGIHFVNLQYDQCEEEIRAAEEKHGIHIHRWPELDLMNDLDEVAALNANLDLVITSPTAVGELSGALGIPTWTMLLKYESAMDLGTGAMPWEPAVRLYYRNWDDTWERVIDLVSTDLRTLASAGASPSSA